MSIQFDVLFTDELYLKISKNAIVMAEKLKNCPVKITAKAGANGKLFGAITAKEISEELKKQFGVAAPKVGLLNIGTEDSKGTPLQKEAYALLTDAHEKGLLNFVGNVEARDVPLGAVDVVVCDGFAGNVLLKSIEGTAMFMGSLMKHKIFKRSFLSKIGYLFCKPGVDEVMGMLDYRTIGGTEFLGIRKPVIKAHGSSNAKAFKNAMAAALTAAGADMDKMTAAVEAGASSISLPPYSLENRVSNSSASLHIWL